MDKTFESFEVVQHLKRESHSLYSSVEQLYTICDELLSEIPMFFSNYTLHNIEHSIRVIGYMNDLIKDHLNKLSPLHLAIVVYAGLLHDTGMVVTSEEIKSLCLEFSLKDRNFNKLPESEKIAYLQDYIRKTHAKRVRSILEKKINADTAIKSVLYIGKTKSYDLSNVVADICQSHTENCDWITTHLDSVMYYEDYKINPQHIAALLRIGDALDIDDRRAPFVLYRLLNPQGLSDSEWRKHIPITNYEKIRKADDAYELSFSGQCSEPDVFRKLNEYIEWIQNDCARINSMFTDEYRINIALPIRVNIKTTGFVNSPLRFTLEYRQIAKLLMGEKIYGSKKDGLRELLQNAIDAALLMSDIMSNNPYSTYAPTVGIVINKNTKQFIVFDNGVGMTEEILRQYFFNIGNSYYASSDYHSGEHNYRPIGHFGIGFLACFMLSSRITLETKHYESGKLIRMSFDKDSPYITRYSDDDASFPLAHGTRIIMDYDQLIPSVFPNEKAIEAYTKELLTDNKYTFILINSNSKKKELRLKKLRGSYYTDNDSCIQYEYQVSPITEVLFNPFSWFGKDNSVYIIDYDSEDTLVFTLSYLDEVIRDAERELQLMGVGYDDDIEIDMSDALDKLSEDCPPFFIDLIVKYFGVDAFFEYYRKHHELHRLFIEYILSFVSDSTLIWYDIPIVLNKDSFQAFLRQVEEKGLEEALEETHNVKFVSVLCREEEIPDSNAVLEVLSDYISLNADSKDATNVDYYTEYPITPIKKQIDLLKHPQTNDYIHVLYKNQNFEKCIYLKGILVRDDSITIPYAIGGITIKSIILNIKSDDYGIDVSRNSFDNTAKEMISKQIANIVYTDVAKNKRLSKVEKELINLFLEVYYS